MTKKKEKKRNENLHNRNFIDNEYYLKLDIPSFHGHLILHY